MSKWTKFKKHPQEFFKDMLLKRLPFLKKTKQKETIVTNNVNLIKPVKSMSQTGEKQKETMITNNVNLMEPVKFILHTGEKEGALAHLNIWIPCFEKSSIPYIILTRHQKAYDDTVSKYPYLKIAFAKNKADIDLLLSHLSLVRACFYPSNTGNNLHLLFYNNIKHIFIGHGDSDKTASAHKFFRVYDENWVAGDAHIDRFNNAGFDYKGLKQVKVGRPNLYDAIKASEEKWFQRFESNYKLLYLPTWEGTYKEQDYSSLSILKKSIELLHQIDSLDISLKLHPFSGRREKKFKHLERELQNSHICQVISKDITVDSVMRQSNLFICDISAVVSECLAVNAPIFLYIPEDKEIKISKSNMPYEQYCYIYSSSEELFKKLQDILGGNDYLQENREKAMEYILNKKDTLNNTFDKKLKQIGA